MQTLYRESRIYLLCLCTLSALLSLEQKEVDNYMKISFFFEILEAFYQQVISYTLADWCSVFSILITVWDHNRNAKKK